MDANDLIVVDRLPTVAEYLALRRSAGWRLPVEADAELALDNSLFGVCAECDGEVVAMGRVVGDGSLNFYLQDLVVEPGFQDRGIGRVIVGKLEEAVAGRGAERAALLLVAGQDVEPFYLQLGYERLPDEVLGKHFNVPADSP